MSNTATIKNQTYVCGTFYHLYISILKSREYRRNGMQCMAILHDFTPALVRLASRLEQSGFFDQITTVPFKTDVMRDYYRTGFFNKTFRRNQVIIAATEKHFDTGRYNAFLTNAEINIFFNLGIGSAYFVLKYPRNFIRMLEDGERNYNSRLGLGKRLKRKYLYRSFVGEGNDKAVREIHVQQPERLLERVQHKGVVLDVRGLRNALTADERKKLLELFIPPDLNQLPLGDDTVLLITQPLSEDGFVPEKDKIAMYRAILDRYALNRKVFVKLHPRETTDYGNSLGNDITFIPRSFPLEMLDMLPGLRFHTGITIFSSALLNCDCISHKIFLGTDYDKRLAVKERLL